MSTKLNHSKNYNKVYEEAIIKMMTKENMSSTYLFYAHVISQCVFKVTEQIPTLGVRFNNNKYELAVNPTYFDSLEINKAMGVLKHEALHILYKHTVREPEPDYHHLAFNYACDIAINQHINQDDLPDGCLTHEQYNLKPNLTAEQYYFLLKEQHEKKEQEKDSEESDQQDQSDQQDSQGNQDSQDQQDSQEQDSDSQDSQDQQGSQDQGGTPHDPFDVDESKQGKPGNGTPTDVHDWDSCKEVDEELLNDVTSDMIDKAQKKSKGHTPQDLDLMLKLFSNKAVVNWRQVLRKYTGKKRANSRKTIKRRNRRFTNRLDVQGKTKDYTYEVLCIVDVSGSMSDEEIYKGLSEIQSICTMTDSDMRLIQVDSSAKPSETFDKNQKTWARKASGGTELYPAIEQAQKEKLYYDVLIVISDMGIWGDDVTNFESLKVPQIWLSTASESNPFSSKNIRVFPIS